MRHLSRATVKAGNRKMRPVRNIVGPQIRKLREERGLTQPMLAARCNLLGWGLSRETLAKIETQVRWVADAELLCFSYALKVPLDAFLPKTKTRERMQEFFRGLGKT